MGVFVKVVKMMFVSLADFSLTETTMPRFRTSPPLGLFKVYSARGSGVAVGCRVVWFCVVVHSSVVLCGLVWYGVVWLCCSVLWCSEEGSEVDAGLQRTVTVMVMSIARRRMFSSSGFKTILASESWQQSCL